MIDAIMHYVESKTHTKTTTPEARVAPKAPPGPEAQHHQQPYGYTRMFRWPVAAGQTPQPRTVEILGSFTDWRRVPLAYDSPTKTWLTTLNNIQGNHTHHYVVLVDGKPCYDKTCDGLVVPEGPEEEKWQIATPRGPRVMLMFGQTK